MKIEDSGFVIFSKKYGETSLLVKVFSESNGIVSGYIRGARSNPKNLGKYQSGNAVRFCWSARNDDQLGSLNIELLHSYSSILFAERLKIYIFNAANTLLNSFIQERHCEREIYNEFVALMELLDSCDAEDEDLLRHYVLFEKQILDTLGIGLELQQCAVTQRSDGLYYVSPKTGRVVCREIGESLASRLLLLPQFMGNDVLEGDCRGDILCGLRLTGHFLKKYLVENNLVHFERCISEARDKLLKCV